MKRKRFTSPAHMSRQRDRYRNPNIAETGKGRPIRNTIAILIFFALIGGIFYGALQLPWLQIKHVEVTGTITLQPTRVQEHAWQTLHQTRYNVLPEKHFWFLQTDALAQSISDEFSLRNTVIERKGRTLTIAVEEGITRGIWVQNNTFSFLGSDGTIRRTLTEEEIADVRARVYGEGEQQGVLQTDVFLIFNLDTNTTTEDSLLTSEAQQTLEQTFDLFADHWLNFEAFFLESPDSEWFTVKTKNGLDVYFDFVDDAQGQFAHLETALEKQGSAVNDLSYIDLRFGNKVFLK